MRTAPAWPPTPPPFTMRLHFKLIEHLSELERLDRSRVPGHVPKIVIDRASVDGELSLRRP